MFSHPKTLQTPFRIFPLLKRGFPPPRSRRSCWCPLGLCTLVWTGLPPARTRAQHILTGRYYICVSTADHNNTSGSKRNNFSEEGQTVLRPFHTKHKFSLEEFTWKFIKGLLWMLVHPCRTDGPQLLQIYTCVNMFESWNPLFQLMSYVQSTASLVTKWGNVTNFVSQNPILHDKHRDDLNN